MKHFLPGFLGICLLLSMTLSSCIAPPVPDTKTPLPATATHTLTATRTVVSPSPTSTASPTFTATPSYTATPGGLPNMPDKPVPQSSTFQGCPPQGDGGDAKLNVLKNRIDEGDYVPVTFNSIASLTWPKTTERRDMDSWSAQDAAAIAKYEGIPVVVEGFIAAAKQSGSESANCHGTSATMTDWHVWFTKSAGEDRTRSIVIETTPRIRALHKWTLKMMDQIAKDQTPVRISGWLFFDPEHPDQILKTRGTIWEIHPIMQIEVMQNGQWVPLDQLAP